MLKYCLNLVCRSFHAHELFFFYMQDKFSHSLWSHSCITLFTASWKHRTKKRNNLTQNQKQSCLFHLFLMIKPQVLMSVTYDVFPCNTLWETSLHDVSIACGPLQQLPSTLHSWPAGGASSHMVGYHILFISKQRRTPQAGSEKNSMQEGIASTYRGVLRTIHSQSERGRKQHIIQSHVRSKQPPFFRWNQIFIQCRQKDDGVHCNVWADIWYVV